MPITIGTITVKNPCLFRHFLDLDIETADPRYLVNDSMEDVLELDDVMWIKMAQLCSVMSVFWIQNKVGVQFRLLSAARQLEIATVVAANQTPDAQFTWARDQLHYTEITSLATATKLLAGTKVLFYTPRHVCAAIIQLDGKWLIYDPESASADEYTVEQASPLYLSHATRFLHGR